MSVLETQVGLFQKIFARKLCKVSRFRARVGVFTAQRINGMGNDQVVSGPSAYVAKRTQREDESTLLCHMDDVVGTA